MAVFASFTLPLVPRGQSLVSSDCWLDGPLRQKMLRYVSHPRLIVPESQEPSVVKLSRSKVKTKSAEHVSSMASRHSKKERNHCMLSAVPHISESTVVLSM